MVGGFWRDSFMGALPPHPRQRANPLETDMAYIMGTV